MKTIHRGKWIELNERTHNNTTWEYASRTHSTEACSIVGIIDKPYPKVILIKQYRIPLKDYIIEFPAGLIENETPETAGLREFTEETGYIGETIYISPKIYNSPGFSDEATRFMIVNITGKTETSHEADENIEVIEVRLKDLLKFLKESKTPVSAKVWFYAEGLTYSTS